VTGVRSNSRCAIYTRKSSDEGLEQSFNSLHAQREACEAYILSQKHEGWSVVKAEYNDGGFSGGNMERPGLKRLLEDIAAKKIDTVVVYKVDRLTRSLGDFARIVEQFDSQGVSFVSVTQQFNTTSSMGRLTLNVLLSFAQFEREVTGERIRDKVAASKKKGMWMGGWVPIGYDRKDRQLIVDEAEAKQVREIFKQYLRLKSVYDLNEYLKARGIRSKPRTTLTGRTLGSAIMSRGTLYHLLSNPIYIGKITHKGELFQGQHKPIVDMETWQRTAELLKSNAVVRRTTRNIASGRPLAGLLFDEEGNRFIPTHASKNGRRYDYYICRNPETHKVLRRIQAGKIELIVIAAIHRLLLNSAELTQQLKPQSVQDARILKAAAQQKSEVIVDLVSPETREFLRKCIQKITIKASEVGITLDRALLYEALTGKSSNAESSSIELSTPFTIKRRGDEARLILTDGTSVVSQPASNLLKSIARARDWAEQIAQGRVRRIENLTKSFGMTKRYTRRILKCAALSPRLVEAIVNESQPEDLTVARLMKGIHLDWNAQSFPGRTERVHAEPISGTN